VIVVYKNTGSKAVKFRYVDAVQTAEVYRSGNRKPLIGGYISHGPHSEVTLMPGESVQFDEAFNLAAWHDLAPGKYEIRFFYHLWLLRDESLAQKYKNKYPNEGYLVPWEDRKHPFTIVK
jgi:hypothetical protein